MSSSLIQTRNNLEKNIELCSSDKLKCNHVTLNELDLAFFRTKLCEAHQKGQCKNADSCPYSHCLTWQRRDPYMISYSAKLCPEIEFVKKKDKKMNLMRHCKRGKACAYAHSKEEELYHPLMYKTKMCSVFPNCNRFYCPFAHSKEEIRKPQNMDHIKAMWGTNFFLYSEKFFKNSQVLPNDKNEIKNNEISFKNSCEKYNFHSKKLINSGLNDSCKTEGLSYPLLSTDQKMTKNISSATTTVDFVNTENLNMNSQLISNNLEFYKNYPTVNSENILRHPYSMSSYERTFDNSYDTSNSNYLESCIIDNNFPSKCSQFSTMDNLDDSYQYMYSGINRDNNSKQKGMSYKVDTCMFENPTNNLNSNYLNIMNNDQHYTNEINNDMFDKSNNINIEQELPLNKSLNDSFIDVNDSKETNEKKVATLLIEFIRIMMDKMVGSPHLYLLAEWIIFLLDRYFSGNSFADNLDFTFVVKVCVEFLKLLVPNTILDSQPIDSMQDNQDSYRNSIHEDQSNTMKFLRNFESKPLMYDQQYNYQNDICESSEIKNRECTNFEPRTLLNRGSQYSVNCFNGIEDFKSNLNETSNMNSNNYDQYNVKINSYMDNYKKPVEYYDSYIKFNKNNSISNPEFSTLSSKFNHITDKFNNSFLTQYNKGSEINNNENLNTINLNNLTESNIAENLFTTGLNYPKTVSDSNKYLCYKNSDRIKSCSYPQLVYEFINSNDSNSTKSYPSNLKENLSTFSNFSSSTKLNIKRDSSYSSTESDNNSDMNAESIKEN